jgi:hypothetical protein
MRTKTYENLKRIGRLVLRNPKVYLPYDFDNESPAIFMANHEGFYGPAIVALRFPVEIRPWSHSGVVFHEESHEYIMGSFPGKLPNVNPRIARLIARIISKPVVNTIRMANPIPAYHDFKRSIQSVRLGIKSLGNSENQLIFSNTPVQHKGGRYNPDFNFMQGYLLVVRKAMKQGIIPKIYPVSINRKKASISIGNPVFPNPNADWLYEKQRIHDYLIKEVLYGHQYPAREYDEIRYMVQQLRLETTHG